MVWQIQNELYFLTKCVSPLSKCAVFKQLLIGKGLQMTFTDMVVFGMEVGGCFV